MGVRSNKRDAPVRALFGPRNPAVRLHDRPRFGSLRLQWLGSAGLYHPDMAGARPYFGAGLGRLWVSFSGYSASVNFFDLLGGTRFALNEAADLFVEGHYWMPAGGGSGVPGTFVLTGGVLYQF